MIELESIKFKNIMSYGDDMAEFKLNNLGTTVIIGGNGAGKSTIIEAMYFALFGKCLRNINKGQIVNYRNKKDMYVELNFHTLNGNQYKLIRGIKPDIHELYENGQALLQKASPTLFQLTLDNITRLDPLLFTQLTLQSKTNGIPFLELKPELRRKFVDQVFSLDVYRMMTTLNNDKLKLIKKELELKKKDIESTHSMIEARQLHLDSLLKLKEASYEHANGEFESNKLILETALDELKVKADAVNAELKELGELEGYLETKTHDEHVNSINKLLHDVEYNGKEYAKLITFFESHEECPTCKQYLNPQFRKTKVSELTDLKEELKPIYLNHKQDLMIAKEGLNEVVEKNKKITEKSYLINNLKSNLTSLRNTYKEQKARLTELLELGVVIVNYDNDIDTAMKSLELAKSTLEGYEVNLNDISNNLLIAEQSSKILGDSGAIATVIDTFIPMLNESVNKYLGILGLDKVFEMDKTFNDNIYTYFGAPTSYHSLSEGEKLRVNLAMLLAWRDISNERGLNYVNVLFFDETFDSSMDQKGIDSFIEILYNLDNINIYIISHTPNKINAEHSYYIDNVNGFSVIREI